MFEKLAAIEKRFDDLSGKMSDPKIIALQNEFQKYAREHSELVDIVKEYRDWKKNNQELEENRALLEEESDPEMKDLARQEIETLTEQTEKNEQELKKLLLPRDPRDEKSVIMEIRAGTGGDEAGLFAADLYRMYSRYAERQKWKVEIMTSNPTGVGGFKEVVLNIRGKAVYSKLKYEAGTHRVQRVPTTETQGRIHTSAVTVAILPEVEDVEININPVDLKIDVFRASGPGGQSVNTTDSAVRITHVPSGLVVSCQDEKSQHKNKERGMKVLRARLYDEEQRKQQEVLAADRRQQVGTGDRSERIRTYNFPQERISDHRIGFTMHKLSQAMEGELDDMVEALILHYQAEALKNQKN